MSGGSGGSGGLSVESLADHFRLSELSEVRLVDLIDQEVPRQVYWNGLEFNPLLIGGGGEGEGVSRGQVDKEVIFRVLEDSQIPLAVAEFYSRAAALQAIFEAQNLSDCRSAVGFEFVNDSRVYRLEDMGQIVSLIFNVLLPPLSIGSVTTYKGCLERMGRSGLGPLEYAVREGLSKKTLRKYRAAYLRKTAEEMILLIDKFLVSGCRVTEQEIYDKTAQISFYWNRSRWGVPEGLKVYGKIKGKSKRKTLKGLPLGKV